MKQIIKNRLEKRIFFILLIIVFLIEKSFSINDALKIKISNATHSDETIVRFIGGATTDFDYDYDAWKLFPSNQNVPVIFSKIDSVSALSINAFPDLTEKKSVELFLRINLPGLYTIQAFEIGAFVNGASIMLEDVHTGMTYSFRNNSSITLNLSTASITSSSRFILHFSPPTTILFNNVSCNSLQNGSISVNKTGNNNFNVCLKNSFGDTLQVALFVNELIDFTELSIGNYIVETYSTYCNADTNYITITQPLAIIADFTFNYINETTLQFVNNSSNADRYVWMFGDGFIDSLNIEPSYQYASDGTYSVSLIASDSMCSVTFTQTVEILQTVTDVNFDNELDIEQLSVFQKENALLVNYSGELQKSIVLSVYNSIGQLVYYEKLNASGFNREIIPVSTGSFIVLLEQSDKQLIKKINFIK